MEDNHRNSVALFADQDVGFRTVEYLLEKHPSHIRCVVTTGANEIAALARSRGCETLQEADLNVQTATALLGGTEVIFLAWWPRIIPGYIIDIPETGVINFHPSLLPYNRGKNYNFWTIVENTLDGCFAYRNPGNSPDFLP